MIPLWIRLSVAGAASMLVGMAIGRFSYTLMMPALIEAGALSASQAGYVQACNLLGYPIGAVVAWRLAARWGEARTMRICLAVSLAALIASIAPWGFAWLAFWRFAVGAAVSVIMIYSLAIATRSAPPGRLGAATGIVFTGVGVGILLAGLLVPVLLAGGLAAAWAGLAAVGALGVAVALWGWRGAEGGGHAGAPASARIGWSWTLVGLVTMRTLFVLGLVPHTIYWVDYVVRGLDRDIGFGGAQWALFGIGALGGTYLWGRLADRIGFRVGLALAFAAVAGGVALPMVVTATWALVISSLVVGAQPGLTAVMAGRTHQLVGDALMPGALRWMGIVAGICQLVAGYAYVTLFETTGSYVPVFLTGAASMASGAVIAALLGRRTERAPHASH